MPGTFECEFCEKTFNEEWKMDAHVKLHKKYSCDKCEKSFELKDIRDKHVRIAHEGLKIYCYYYNNAGDCLHEDQCVFLHEDSPMCKYGQLCERNNCMFKHQTLDDSSDDDDNDVEEKDDTEEVNTSTEIEEDDESKIVSVDENDCDEEDEDDDAEELKSRKCDHCVFETTDKKRFKRHQFEIHSTKGKYTCMGCKEEFDTRTKFNNHKYFGCSPKL